MERLFSKPIDVLRAAAADDIERKVRICSLLRSRNILLRAALPPALALAGVTVMLISFYAGALRNETDANFFWKIADIFSVYAVALLTVTFTFLSIVVAADKMLSLLSSLRPDEYDTEDPAVPFAAPSPGEQEREPVTIETANDNAPQEDEPLDFPKLKPIGSGSHPDPFAKVLGKSARIDKAAESCDFGGVARTFLEHALRGEHARFDEKLLLRNSEGGSKIPLQLPQ